MSFFDDLKDTTLLVGNYKSFGMEPQGFIGLEPINILVGRNNSGKSALLDLVQFACGSFNFASAAQNSSGTTEAIIEVPLLEQHLRMVFQQNTSGGDIHENHWTYGSRFIGSRMKVRLMHGGKSQYVDASFSGLPNMPTDRRRAVAANIRGPLEGKIFKRLGADRDIIPEGDSTQISIAQNGSGFTNAVQRFINKSSLPNSVVERLLLEELNRIFAPDAEFKNVRVRQHDNGSWEVYLEEQSKGAVALSHSGSGLKTILLVLGFLILMPRIEGKPLSDYVFAFEELENNLHPSLQRRLVKYICDSAIRNEFAVFFTTHSSAVIDMLSHNTQAQIVHVYNSEGATKARRVATYVENRGILDDLDVRASDLLQANGIVWVEGPSDRLYFNRWIGLATKGLLQEGVHYQCVFYGGRLLAHLSGVQPFDDVDKDQAVRIFRVNRNAIVLIDSDKAQEDADINHTKSRIVTEVEALGGLAWVTAGREVENYLPREALQRCLPGLTARLEPFDDLAEFLNRYRDGAGKKFERNKVLFAESIIPLIERADLGDSLDLEAKLVEASRMIAGWNRISTTWLN